MKSSQILREAARLVESGAEITGCGAIVTAAGVPGECAEDQVCFEYFECVEPTTPDLYWWPLKIRHGPRIIGLCLAASIAESEGD